MSSQFFCTPDVAVDFTMRAAEVLSEADCELKFFEPRRGLSDADLAAGNAARLKIALDWLVFYAKRGKEMQSGLRALLEPILDEKLNERGVFDPQDE